MIFSNTITVASLQQIENQRICWDSNKKSIDQYTKKASLFVKLYSDRVRIQTWNLLIRSQMLYSIELRSHSIYFKSGCKYSCKFLKSEKINELVVKIKTAECCVFADESSEFPSEWHNRRCPKRYSWSTKKLQFSIRENFCYGFGCRVYM